MSADVAWGLCCGVGNKGNQVGPGRTFLGCLCGLSRQVLIASMCYAGGLTAKFRLRAQKACVVSQGDSLVTCCSASSSLRQALGALGHINSAVHLLLLLCRLTQMSVMSSCLHHWLGCHVG